MLVEVPDYAEAIEAWRVWRIVSVDGELGLSSVVQSTIWPAGRSFVAECLRRRTLPERLRRRARHEAPHADCECGIYAGGPSEIRRYLTEPLARSTLARVFGRVALWGQVVECERGYRASRAYPLELFVPADARRRRNDDLEGLALALSRYEVPVEVLSGRSRDVLALVEDARSA
jgi:hypothetical protein